MTRGLVLICAPMDVGGPIQNVSPLRKSYRCFQLSVSNFGNDKTANTNQAGMPNHCPDHDSLNSPRKPLRVVIVEDEAIIAMELEMLLEELNVEVIGVALSAAEAEAMVAAERPDCVTMDINIQGDRDGVDAACNIFQKYGVRSIFVSAYGNADIKARAEPANPIGWVTKPVEPHKLEEMLRGVDRTDV